MPIIDLYLEQTKESNPEAEERLKLRLDEAKEKINPNSLGSVFDINTLTQLTKLMLVAVDKENGTDDLAINNAIKLAILFGDANKAIEYLKAFEKKYPTSHQLVHDACLFSLPEEINFNIKLWQSLAPKNILNPLFTRVLPFAKKIEEYVETHLDELAEQIRENETSQFETNLSVQYDKKEEKQNLIEAKVAKDFQGYIKKQLNLPKGKLTAEQAQSLQQRLNSLTQDDLAVKKDLEIKEQIKFQEKQKKLAKSINQSKQEFIAQQLQLEGNKKTLEANIKSKIDNLLSTNTPSEQLYQYMLKVGYPNAHMNPEAAELFLIHGLGEKQFNQYLELKPHDDANLIPLVDIIQIKKYPSYYLQKLDPHDPRAAVLGKITSCCQSLGSAGETSALHGITSPYGGFYVLRKQTSSLGPQKNDPIYAQSWAWRSLENNIVLDSIESQVNFRQKNLELMIDFYKELAHTLVKKHQVQRVLVGTGGATPNIWFLQPLLVNRLNEIGIYSDAKVQSIIADSVFAENKIENIGSSINEWCSILVKNNAVGKPPIAELSREGQSVSELINLNKEFLQNNDIKFNDWVKYIEQGVHPDFPKGGRPLIIESARINNLDIIKLCVQKGADIYARDMDENTILHLAVKNTPLKKELITYIVSLGIAIDTKDKYGNTILHLVANNPSLNKELITYIISLGISSDTKNGNGNTILHLVAKNPSLNEELITYLLSLGINDVKNKDGDTIWHLAVRDNNLFLVKLLLENNVRTDLTNNQNLTPLHIAIKNTLGFSFERDKKKTINEFEITKLLFNVTNEKIIKNILGLREYELLRYATEKNDFNFFKYCKEKLHIDNYDTAISYIAAENGSLEILKYILPYINIDASDGYNRPPLHYALNKNQITTAKFLIESGANINIRDNGKNTALSIVAGKGDLDFVKYLVDTHHAEITPMALGMACTKGELEIVKYFINQGIDVNSQEADGATALSTAFWDPKYSQEWWDSIEYLIELKANINTKDPYSGNTPLHYMVNNVLYQFNENRPFVTNVIKFLLEHGAEINVKNSNGQTPLHRAVEKGYIEIADILIKNGADLSLTDVNNLTPPDIAKKAKNVELIKYLENQSPKTAAKVSEVGMFGSSELPLNNSDDTLSSISQSSNKLSKPDTK